MINNNAAYKILDKSSSLNFELLCRLSEDEDMLALDQTKISYHVYGRVMVKLTKDDIGIRQLEPVSYAGITGFEEHTEGRLAVIGSMLTLPQERGKGHNLATTDALCRTALSEKAVRKYGHVGLVAKCNEHSQSITNKLGFEHAGFIMGKALMVRMA